MTEDQLPSWSARSNLVDNHFIMWTPPLLYVYLEIYIIKSPFGVDGAGRAKEEVLVHRTAQREEKRKEERETAAVTQIKYWLTE